MPASTVPDTTTCPKDQPEESNNNNNNNNNNYDDSSSSNNTNGSSSHLPLQDDKHNCSSIQDGSTFKETIGNATGTTGSTTDKINGVASQANDSKNEKHANSNNKNKNNNNNNNAKNGKKRTDDNNSQQETTVQPVDANDCTVKTTTTTTANAPIATTTTATTSDSSPPSSSNPLHTFAAEINEVTRSRHKRILLNLFRHTSDSTMQEIAKKSVAVGIGGSKSKNIRKRRRPMFFCPAREPRRIEYPQLLSSLPLSLFAFHDYWKHANADSSRSSGLILNDSKKRKEYSSRSFQEVQQVVNANFLESQLYKKLCPPENSSSSTSSSTSNINNVAAALHRRGNSSPPRRKKIMTPFALEYNETSIAAIARWAAASDNSNLHGSQTPGALAPNAAILQLPTIPSMSRKCSKCGLFGHYEVECNQLQDTDILELAHETKVQRTLQHLLEKHDSAKEQQHSQNRGEDYMQETNSAGEDEDEITRRYFGCEVCRSALDDDHMLICDGCDKLFHLFCLDPPLREVPEGDWFCLHCLAYDKAVDSNVEVEGCEGFVIEQRKRPRDDGYLRTQRGIGFPSDGWHTAIAVIGDESDAVDDSESKNSKRRRRSTMTEEQFEIDGFTVTAKSTSKSEQVSRRMKAWAKSVDEISQYPLVRGSIVAWFPSVEEGCIANDSSDPLVGVVLAIDSISGQALVRPIEEWKELVLDSWTERTTEAPQPLEYRAIQSIPSGATIWISTPRLHMVGRAPPKGAMESFLSEVLPARVTREQEKFSRTPISVVARKITMH